MLVFPQAWRASLVAAACALAIGVTACEKRNAGPGTHPSESHGGDVAKRGGPSSADGAVGGPVVSTRPPRTNPDALPPAGDDVPADRRALQVTGGAERSVDRDAARAAGLTLVDLSDDWAPIIFADGTGDGGKPLPNGYRDIFIGLANDRTDGDGQPLTRGEHNYLELLGVPPSMSVLRQRFLDDADRTCADVDRGRLLAVDSIQTWGATTEPKELSKHDARGKRLEEARVKAGVADLAALAVAQPKLARDVKTHLRFDAERRAFGEVEKRLRCEGVLDSARHRIGRTDTPMRTAILAFQQKHGVQAQGDLNRATLEALAVPPLDHDFQALRRGVTERAAHAGALLEDGSVAAGAAEPPTYPGRDGQRHPVPDLVGPAAQAVFDALDIADAGDAVAFFRRHAADDFRAMWVAARFPAPPEYYGPQMDLSVEIDRGDIWYDFPFDAKGVRVPQPRERYPALTVFVKWNGERVPLVRWRTTIGGWRLEVASDGQEYYAYKGSDVGPRVWRHIVAAPVWIPPTSSPLSSMVKEKLVNGAFVRVTNYDETGPGYLSAYGLAAAIHELPRRGPEGTTYSDNGIRTHGSFDYLSLRGRFSHGCHRLQNLLAVRLFSFILQHRRVRTVGPMALNFRRQFWSAGDIFDMRLPNRGFYFQLDPPIPVETLEGRIRGTRQTPIAGYVRKPGVQYTARVVPTPTPSDSPDSRAAGGEEP